MRSSPAMFPVTAAPRAPPGTSYGRNEFGKGLLDRCSRRGTSRGDSVEHTARRILATGELPYPNWSARYERSPSRAEKLSDAAADGFTVAHFLTVADIERSARFYETVFGGRILSRGDSSGAPGYIQIANTWLFVNAGGGPTPDKPTVTLSVPSDPDPVSSFMNIRVADIQACYELWRSRGAEFITEPKEKYGETRCYIRDPDGYIIEVGQRKPDFTYG